MAFKFLNNYFYGKAGKRDFTEADLPANRFQLFRDVIKVRWTSMICLNFLYLLIWIPAAVWSFMNAALVLTQANEGAVDAAAYLTPYLLILFPLIAITGPFNIGASYVARNWARDEHAFVWGDFKDAMKRNWKQALLFSLIEGAVPLLIITATRFYLALSAQSLLLYLPAGVLMLIGLVWKLSAMLMPMLIVTYDLSFRHVLRNAFILTMASLPKAIGIKLATLALPILTYLLISLIPSAMGIVIPILLCLYAVFMLAFNKMLIAAYSNAVCEKLLNTRIKDAPTNIGLRPEVK